MNLLTRFCNWYLSRAERRRAKLLIGYHNNFQQVMACAGPAARKVLVHGMMIVQTRTDRQAAAMLASSIVTMDGAASLAGWRISVNGRGDIWKLHAVSPDGREIDAENLSLAALMTQFDAEHGALACWEIIENTKVIQ